MENHMRLPGHRFCPMEDELLLYYLKPKVDGKEVPGKESLICELDLYGDQEPWMIWERFEAERSNDLRKYKDMYFFTQKKKVSAKATRSCRKVGSGGTWKGQTAGKPINLLDQDQKETTTLLGTKNTYTYRNKQSVHDGCWIMYEYELDSSLLLPKKRVNKNDYVLCVLRKNDEHREKRKKNQQQEEMLEDYVEDEDGKSNMNSDPAIVVEGSQEKRQRLLLFSDNYEAAPSFNWADIEQWFNVNQAAPLEAEQEARPAPLLEDKPAVALPGDEDLRVQQLATEENLGQQCHAMPTFAATETIASGLDSHHDENMVQKMGDDVGVVSEVDVYGGSFSDLMVGQDWGESHMEDILNDEQLLSMDVSEWNDLVDFSFLD